MKNSITRQLGKRLRPNQKTAIFMLCVLLSMVFWIFTSLSHDYETHIKVPVSYQNIPFTKYFDSDLPRELDLYFKGSGFKLSRVHFRNKPDSIKVDVAALSKGKQVLNIQTLALKNQFPGDVKPYRIFPETIVAGYSSRLSKKVPVEFNGAISFRQRYEATEKLRLTPDSIELAGQKQLLDQVSKVKTERVVWTDISDMKSGKLRLDSSSFKGLASSVSTIDYFLPVTEFTEGVIEIPVELPVSQQSSVTLLPNKVAVTFMVSLADYPLVNKDDFRVITEVPFSDKPSKLQLILKKKPTTVRIIKLDPEFVDYIIEK